MPDKANGNLVCVLISYVSVSTLLFNLCYAFWLRFDLQSAIVTLLLAATNVHIVVKELLKVQVRLVCFPIE